MKTLTLVSIFLLSSFSVFACENSAESESRVMGKGIETSITIVVKDETASSTHE